MKVRVRDTHLNYNGIRYFTAGSEDIGLGSYGLKKSGFNVSRLDPEDDLPIEEYVEVDAKVIDILDNRSVESELEINGKGVINGVNLNGKISFSKEKYEVNKLRLVKLSISKKSIKKYINKRKDLVEELKSFSNNLRIVSSIFIVVTAEFSESISRTGNVTIDSKTGLVNLDGIINRDTDKTTKVLLEPDTCFAYLLVKPKWDKARKKKRTKIKSLRTDMWSIG